MVYYIAGMDRSREKSGRVSENFSDRISCISSEKESGFCVSSLGNPSHPCYKMVFF
ncbi:unnamed protein product [Meloidogyne enterolobii]|uniref:Uncharacterized protein n=1 Tax=Meloidogyne enterolobii TaxID=390850 RepID=A0ACB1B4L1_MELEN